MLAIHEAQCGPKPCIRNLAPWIANIIFKKNGFYAILKKRVIELLTNGDAKKMRTVTKPSFFYLLKVFSVSLIYLISWFCCCFAERISYLAIFSCLFARMVMVGIGHEAVLFSRTKFLIL